MPPKVNGPPGHEWLCTTFSTQPESASSSAGAHGRPARQSESAAASVPIDKATRPAIARMGLSVPPRIGWVQIASTGARHVAGEAEAWATSTRLPTTIPAAVSKTMKLIANTNKATRHTIAGASARDRTNRATASADKAKSGTWQ